MTSGPKRDWGKHLLILAGGAAVAFGAPACFTSGEVYLRSAGGLLQVLGVAGVAHSILKLREDYGLDTISKEVAAEAADYWRKLKAAWRRLWGKPGRIISLKAKSGIYTSDGSGATLGFAPVLDMSHEARIGRLEDQIKILKEAMDSTNARVATEENERRRVTELEADERQKADAALLAQVSKLAVGDIKLEIVGLLWLLAGIVLSTWAPELV